MSAGAILGGASIGAGVGVSSVALAPFNAANTFMGSAFFGYGMILGERYAYQEDWPKIQARLVNGEKIENIIQEYTGRFTAVVMKEAKIIFETVTREFIEIMKQALLGALPAGPEIREDAPTIGDPRRPKPPHTITEPVPTPPPKTPISILQPPSGGTAFIPKKFNVKDITSRNPASAEAIGQILMTQELSKNVWKLLAQITNGKWKIISQSYKSKLAAASAAAQAWPSPNYYPSYRGNGILYFAIK